MNRLPRNWSRTSTQAISVPKTTLTTTTISDEITVSFRAATAWGAVTASQKAPMPPSSEVAATAAIGSSTMMLR